MKKRFLALTLALSLLLTSCGGDASAATMHLRKTEGTVGVSDDGGKYVAPREALDLYSGYGVDTASRSYAWIDLDQVKLTKLDQDSEIAITKEDKLLEIEVMSGSLFFNVTEPLADDETMTIRTSTMAVGIRGTCGWVVSNGDRGAQLFLLEGAAEAEAADTGETVQVAAGQMAEVAAGEDGEMEITVQPFAEEHIVPFVLEELEDDDALCAAILEDSGLNVLDPPDPAERLRAEYLELINSRPVLDGYAANPYTANGVTYANEGLSYAAIVDFDGDGTEELILVTQQGTFNGPEPILKLEVYGESQGHAALYGEVDFSQLQKEYDWDGIAFNPNNFYLVSHNGQIYAAAYYAVQFVGDWFVYAIEDKELTLVEHTAYEGPSDQYGNDESSWAFTKEQNLCPPVPEDVQGKNALLGCMDPYAAPVAFCFAKLVNTDLYLLEEWGGSFEKYSWNGTAIESDYLEENVRGAWLMDMDQDGSEELILILDNNRAVAYSWKGASLERTLLREEAEEYDGFVQYDGLYRDTVTGNIYLGSTDWVLLGQGAEVSYDSLTENLDFSFHTSQIYEDHFDGRMYDELTPEEQAEANRLTNEAAADFERDTARFELVESIDLSQDNHEFYDRLQPTVDQVLQQLMAR